MIFIGIAQKRSEQYDKALDSFRRTIALNPDTDTLTEAHYDIGSLYNDLKQYDKAVHSLREALRLKPADARASYELGLAYVGMGRKNEALEVYRPSSLWIKRRPIGFISKFKIRNSGTGIATVDSLMLRMTENGKPAK